MISELIIAIPILLIALSAHEFCHGYASYKLGDPTPKQAGRLTLNPIPHLDPMGSLVLIITRRIGWAKPVPVNPRYYKNPRKGMMLVGLAGPGANIIIAIFFSLFFRFGFLDFLNIFIGFRTLRTIVQFIQMGIIINLSLAIFNLLPIPPLDGSKILRGFLPRKYDDLLYKLEGPAGMMILMLLVFTGLLGRIIFPIVTILYSVLIPF